MSFFKLYRPYATFVVAWTPNVRTIFSFCVTASSCAGDAAGLAEAHFEASIIKYSSSDNFMLVLCLENVFP